MKAFLLSATKTFSFIQKWKGKSTPSEKQKGLSADDVVSGLLDEFLLTRTEPDWVEESRKIGFLCGSWERMFGNPDCIFQWDSLAASQRIDSGPIEAQQEQAVHSDGELIPNIRKRPQGVVSDSDQRIVFVWWLPGGFDIGAEQFSCDSWQQSDEFGKQKENGLFVQKYVQKFWEDQVNREKNQINGKIFLKNFLKTKFLWEKSLEGWKFLERWSFSTEYSCFSAKIEGKLQEK